MGEKNGLEYTSEQEEDGVSIMEKNTYLAWSIEEIMSALKSETDRVKRGLLVQALNIRKQTGVTSRNSELYSQSIHEYK